jgi:adenosylcobinamide-GDP ribazoletransferase
MLDPLIFAFTFLTVLPLGWLSRSSNASPGKMFSFFPVVGLVIGIIVSLVASIGFLPKDLTAFLTLVVWVGLTGGLHLDGLADSCDGLLATVSPERRLEIMKDPRAGSWAVVGIVLTLLGKWIALRTLSSTPALLVIPPIAGRWAMVLAVAAFPNARSSGLAAQFRVGFGRDQVVIASALAIILTLICGALFGWQNLIALIIAPITSLLIGRWAANRLGGGLTGDVYGAICELTELLCLIGLSIA